MTLTTSLLDAMGVKSTEQTVRRVLQQKVTGVDVMND